MEQLDTFIKRLAKIGIKIECIGNYPWIYIDKINGKRVTEKFEAEHGFTVAFLPAYIKYPFRFTDLNEIFKLIRKYTTCPCCELPNGNHKMDCRCKNT